VNLFYGYFFMDYLEIGWPASISTDDAVQAFAVGPKAELQLRHRLHGGPVRRRFAPVRRRRFKDTDRNDDSAIVGVEAGAKFFITEYAAISAALVGELATDDIYPVKDGKSDNTDLRLELGMEDFSSNAMLNPDNGSRGVRLTSGR